jgi:urease accessory protein
MLIGACAGLSGLSMGAAEQAIAASLLLLGLLISRRVQLPAAACVVLAGSFAFFHGYAHGAEAPLQSSVAAYVSGLLLTTAGLHIVGLAIGRWLERHGAATLTRWLGAALALSGIVLMAS